MASPYRDRTAEFRSLSQTLKKIGGATTAVDQPNNSFVSPKPPNPASSRSEFNKKASRIGLGIHEASQKIARLAKYLQTLQNLEIVEGNYSQDRVVHSTTVCDDLKSKLMGATKELQDVLTTRTENIKAHESRKQIFSANALRDSPFRQHAQPVTEPPPWSSPVNASESSQPSALPPGGVQVGNQLRRRPAVDNAPSHHMEMSMLQQVVPRQENYSQSRAVALHNVESTITELGGIFTHLATMVAQQGELAIRIDDNMDESLANVEGARNALLRHLNQISSNRWLMIKIFAVIIFFLTVFMFFVA
ncbi:hypothetical protein CISIN_1g019591mg [Citrus sinensis]|uniref:t-SNARE coiled-coil homology domain-containing protein n=1 Tax=Citrus sinensis TaxID=2711 RepID=A0A067G0P7_CITSI|nr:hypothetical protein CISIN_1g019591mg [Citrus sinensis]